MRDNTTPSSLLPLPPSFLKLVLFDMDLTLLNMHTKGCYSGPIDDLVPHVVSPFVELVPRLLASQYHVGIVTFSDALMARHSNGLAGDNLVHELLTATWRKLFIKEDPSLQLEQNQSRLRQKLQALMREIHVVAAFPWLQNEQPAFGLNPMPNNKSWHIEKIKAKLKTQGVRVRNDEILFFDDSMTNVEHAASVGIHAFTVNKKTALTADLWCRAVATLRLRQRSM